MKMVPRCRFRSPRALASGLVALLALLGCPGSRPDQAERSRQEAAPQGEKDHLLKIMRQNYLWSENLPAVDPASYPTPKALLEALTRKASGGKDRWTRLKRKDGARLVTLDASEPDPGFGFKMDLRDTGGDHPKVFVAEVWPGSSAAKAGFGRGDQVLRVGESANFLEKDHGLTPAGAAVLVVELASAPLKPGAQRWFRLKKAGTGEITDQMLVAGTFRLELVPHAAEPRILSPGPDHRVGYLPFREFQRATEPLLRQAIGSLRANQVTDLIVDLRNNNGGDSETCKAFANLLCAGTSSQQVMFRLLWNSQHEPETVHFAPEPEAIRPRKLAFIVNEVSASASEALVNALLPIYGGDLALVGQRTAGKPVACTTFPLGQSDLVVDLAVFRVLNADGRGDYYDGLPDAGFPGATCLAEDDLGHPMGDPAEASTAAALRWIQHGTSARGPIPPRGTGSALP